MLSRSGVARGAEEKSILLERRQGQIIGGRWGLRGGRVGGGGGCEAMGSVWIAKAALQLRATI